MNAIKNINLAIRFALELCMLAVFGWWGYHSGGSGPTKIAWAIAAPLTAAVVWGIFLSPKAKIKLSLAIRVLMELALFSFAGWMLYRKGKEIQGELLVAAFVINRILLLAVKA